MSIACKNNCFLLLVLLLIGTGCKGEKKQDHDKGIAKLFTTTLDKASLLSPSTIIPFETTGKADLQIIVDPNTTFQEMDGFGFTLNGGSALHLQGMSMVERGKLLRELFGTGPDDIGISYLRLSIGASDLDEKPWSYHDLVDGEKDTALTQFSLAYDTLYLIPTLKEIQKIAPNIKLMGSPWSPPKWMKDNKDTRGGSLLKEHYEIYARYLVKYLRAMEEQGVIIDAITVQNEPLHPGNNPSLLMTAEEQGIFVKDHLGPEFAKGGLKTKIVIYDHNADRPDYPISILNDTAAAKFIDGSAFHLYGGAINSLSEVHEAHPNKNLYFTEQWIGAPGNFEGDFPWHMENVVIGATRNWCKTILEWNLAADENQDPHTDRGGCDRCLGALTIIGNEVIRNPAYYIIAHASKFIRPGAVRIQSSVSENVLNVAFKNPEGQLVVILQNKNPVDTTVEVKIGSIALLVPLKAQAIATLTY